MSDDAAPPGDGRLDPVDWDALDDTGWSLSWRWIGLLAALAILARLYWYDHTHNVDFFLAWSPTPLTWIFRLSLVFLCFLVVPPLVHNPDRTRYYWRRFRSNRLAVASLAYLGVFVVAALVGPIVTGRPRVFVAPQSNPPAFFEATYGKIAIDCAGPIVGDGPVKQCVGTLQYPLGTSANGQDMVVLLLSGMHVSLQVAVVTLAIIVPVATTVGVVSGYVGGWTDDVLMRYVDVQQSVPAFVVYVIAIFVVGRGLFLLVAVFGLLNWGNIARLVRSEVLQRREEQYIEAARSAGVSHPAILVRHVLPNVSNTVLVGATQKIPQIVLIETALTYIQLGDVGRRYQSFGETIAQGFPGSYGPPATATWWTWIVPAIVLSVTVIAFSVVGDALRDALDPRGEL